METPAQAGRRQAMECFPERYSISKLKLEKLVRKKISARVKLPRSQASMRIKFTIDLAPLQGISTMCSEAGLALTEQKRSGSCNLRVWQTNGPAATSRFAQLDKAHPMGWGGAKLTAPGKDAAKKVSRVMTLLAPPLRVEHRMSKEVETATIKGYLVTYNEEGRLGLPPRHEEIWGDAAAATQKQLTKYAKRMLGDM